MKWCDFAAMSPRSARPETKLPEASPHSGTRSPGRRSRCKWARPVSKPRWPKREPGSSNWLMPHPKKKAKWRSCGRRSTTPLHQALRCSRKCCNCEPLSTAAERNGMLHVYY